MLHSFITALVHSDDGRTNYLVTTAKAALPATVGYGLSHWVSVHDAEILAWTHLLGLVLMATAAAWYFFQVVVRLVKGKPMPRPPGAPEIRD